MSGLEFTIGKDTALSFFQKMIENIPRKTVTLVDAISEVYERFMIIEAPYQMGDLRLGHTTLTIGEYERYIYSDVPHFEPVVQGHTVMGIENSESQRKWWFWYLKSVLGGSYTPKVGTGNKTSGNDYPTRAFYNAQPEVDVLIQNYLNNIGS